MVANWALVGQSIENHFAVTISHSPNILDP